MKFLACRIALFAAMCAAAGSAAAQQQPAAPPEVFNRVTACRAVTGDAERLACFDAAVAALAQAQAARDVVVVDREAVQQTRRSLFGLAIPEIGRVFGEGREDAIEAGITHVRLDQFGRATFQLDSGAVWTQTDSRRLRHPPRVGGRVRIRRGALGAFLATLGNQPAIRVIRQR